MKDWAKTKILFYGDALRETGFGRLSHEILKRLLKTGKYDISVVAINYDGASFHQPEDTYYDLKDLKKVWPACMPNRQDNLLGQRNLVDKLKKQDFDIFFAIQDSFNMVPLAEVIRQLQKEKPRKFKYIFYYPVDSDLQSDWVEKGIAVADYPVAYTKWGIKKTQEIMPFLTPDYLYHGVDTDLYKPFPTEEEKQVFRNEFFGGLVKPETYLISCVNRNQPRKQLVKVMLAFLDFKEKNPDTDTKLYLHAHNLDLAGDDLSEVVANKIFAPIKDHVMIPQIQKFGQNGLSPSIVAKLYAASDVMVSAATGEGFGFSISESMASGCPFIGPNNTVFPELLGENEERGYLYTCGKDYNFVQVSKLDNYIVRPLPDIYALSEKLKHIYENYDEAQAKAKVARDWISEYTWDVIVRKWENLIDAVVRTP